MELNAETKSVNEILSLNNRYVVPRFQREYSWGQEEIKEFWEDIFQQLEIDEEKNEIKHNEYFIGCIVLVGDESKPEYLIVDGQQRLTTLTILLRAIVERFKDLKEESAAQGLHQNVIQGVNDDGDKFFKLKNESPKPFFQNEIQAFSPENLGSPKSDEEKLIKEAFEFFKTKVDDVKINGFTDVEIVKAIRTQIEDICEEKIKRGKEEGREEG
ncbi:DUF262 domain-containing protein [Baaleninema simplex]|uniref:DUF262 domain-containing protein n=1 Tax=Baaleninema simplex TaxID=2862350 RepID=UPI0004769DBD|nr:DUF262 domain-containing protein [Baaleninema simplex]